MNNENEKNDGVLTDIKNIKTRETYTLPSKGLLYDAVDNIPQSVTLRRMTTKEDKLRLRNENEEQIRKELLQACVLENFDVGKLKIMDANFLLFRLRSLSLLTDEYKVFCRCPECGVEFVHKVNLSEIPIKYINEEKLDLLKIELPISHAKIDLKLPSIDDIITMGKTLKDYMERFPDLDAGEYLYTLSTIVYINKINNNTLLREELEQYVDNMDILDSRSLREIINDLDDMFGFETKLFAKCPSCGRTVSHGLPITRELLTPSK